MEGEGSGFDKMYEVLLTSGRQVPNVSEGDDRVVVTISKRIVKSAIINFIGKANEVFQLTQKERITLGLIAQHEFLTAIQLVRALELKTADDLEGWLGRLPQLEIVKSRGRTKGTEYFIEPELLCLLEFKGSTTLKGIEKHRLHELVLQDLSIYKEAGISEIHERIGKEISRRKLQRTLKELVQKGLVQIKGERKGRRYLLTKPGVNNS